MKKREKVKESLGMIMFALILLIASIVIFLIGQLCEDKIIFIDATILNIMFSVASIFTLVASIFEIIDSITIRKVNKQFKRAFICAITGLILSFLGIGLAFLPGNILIIYEIVEIVALIFETAVFLFYILGIKKIHVDDNNKKMAKFGKIMGLSYIAGNIIFYVLTSVIVGLSETSPVLAWVLSTLSFVFVLLAYIICFVFLYKSKKAISASHARITN